MDTLVREPFRIRNLSSKFAEGAHVSVIGKKHIDIEKPSSFQHLQAPFVDYFRPAHAFAWRAQPVLYREIVRGQSSFSSGIIRIYRSDFEAIPVRSFSCAEFSRRVPQIAIRKFRRVRAGKCTRAGISTAHAHIWMGHLVVVSALARCFFVCVVRD